jgi:Dolichyl-phosphate-mannose-protein mannosyltransferase
MSGVGRSSPNIGGGTSDQDWLTMGFNMTHKYAGAVRTENQVRNKVRSLLVNSKMGAGAVIFLAALLPRVLQLGVFSAPDEELVWNTSNQFATALAQGNLAGTATLFYPGVTLMWAETLAAAAKYLGSILSGSGAVTWTAVLGLDTPFAMLGEKRLVLGLLHVVLVVLIWYWLDDLFGRPVAFLAGLLIALDPFLLAESRVMRTEVLNTEFISLSVVTLLVYLGRERRGFLLASGMFAGLAMLTKMSSLFMIPFIGLVLAVYFGANGFRQQLKFAFAKVMRACLQWSAAAGVTFVGLWPALWVQPVATLQLLWAYTLRVGEKGFDDRGVFFWGQIYPDDPGVWFYPIALAFRVGPLVLPGILFFLVFLIEKARNNARKLDGAELDNITTNWRILAALVVSYVAFMSAIALKYDRYLLPVFPALDLLAGLGLWYAWTRLLRPARFNSRLILPVTAILPILVLGIQSSVCFREHPYYYTYYNPLLGGANNAVRYVPIGYGEGFDVVGQYLASLPNSDHLRVASAKSRDLKNYFPGQAIPLSNLDGLWVQADYVFIYVSQSQRGKHDPEMLAYLARRRAEFVVQLSGLEYGKLYPGPAAQFYSGTKLEGRATLFGYNLSTAELAAGQTLTATVYFRNEGQQPADRFYVRLVDADGYAWADAAVGPRPGFEDAFRAREAIVEGEAALALPVGTPPGQYVLKMGYEDAGTGQAIGEFALPAGNDRVAVDLPPAFPAPGEVQAPHRLDLVLRDELKVAGYGLNAERVVAGGTLWLTLYWQALADVKHDYVVAVQLLDAQGNEATYWLGRPVHSSYPTTRWQRGQVIQDVWRLSLPDKVSPGDYTLRVALFDAETQAEVGRTPLGRASVVK